MAKSRFKKGIGALDTIFIEDPRRAIVIGVALVVVIVLLVLFWSRIKALFQSLLNRNAANSMLNDVHSETGEYQTLSTSSYYMYANQLYNAFRPHLFGLGTDEDAIYNVFNQLNNTADVLQLIKTFGTKDGKTLDVWIRSELGRSEIRKLNSILAGKGISYAF